MSDGTPVSTQHPFWLSPIATAHLQRSTTTIVNITQSGPTQASVVLTSDYFAPYAWLETATLSGRFSDNGFLMPPNSPVTITFTADDPFSLSELQSSLVVRTMVDVYTRS